VGAKKRSARSGSPAEYACRKLSAKFLTVSAEHDSGACCSCSDPGVSTKTVDDAFAPCDDGDDEPDAAPLLHPTARTARHSHLIDRVSHIALPTGLQRSRFRSNRAVAGDPASPRRPVTASRRVQASRFERQGMGLSARRLRTATGVRSTRNVDGRTSRYRPFG
jgi:hypothetical protein